MKTTFLNGDLEEEVFVTQPPSFVIKGAEPKVCKLLKSLYGLKQAPRAWNAKIHAHLLQLSFVNSPTESTLYVRKDGEKLLIVVLYVDDLLITMQISKLILARHFNLRSWSSPLLPQHSIYNC